MTLNGSLLLYDLKRTQSQEKRRPAAKAANLLFIFVLLTAAHSLFTVVFVEDSFADTDALRRNFDEFVIS